MADPENEDSEELSAEDIEQLEAEANDPANQVDMAAHHHELWTSMLGEPPSQSVSDLINSWASYFHGGDPRTLQMIGAFDFWLAYLVRVHQHVDWYRYACRNFDDADVFSHARAAAEMRVLLEIESVYISAKLLLERIATTFCFYFDRKPPKGWGGSMHTFLKKNFPAWHKAIAGDAAHPALSNLIPNLYEHIVDFRSLYIEHPEQPDGGIRHVFVHTLPSGYSYYAAWAYSTKKKGRVATLCPTVLLLTLEGYIQEMVRYFERYEYLSIFRQD